MNFIKNPCFGLIRYKYTFNFKDIKFKFAKRSILGVFSSQNCIFPHGTRHNSTEIPSSKPIEANSKDVLYRYKWIKQLRLISRVKILHVFVVGGLTAPMCVWYSTGLVSGPVVFTAVFAASATTVGLFALSYFFRRVIGELSYDKTADEVTISSLTFWGNRRNVVLPLSALVPLSERGFSDKNLFHRVERYGSNFVYLLNLRHGRIHDFEKLSEVLGLDVPRQKTDAVKEVKIVNDN